MSTRDLWLLVIGAQVGYVIANLVDGDVAKAAVHALLGAFGWFVMPRNA